MENNLIELIQFTDPVCTWCWGSEPIIRKLETEYGRNLKASYVMGGLVKDIRVFNDHANGIGGGAQESNRSIASHWEEASIRHGMPVNGFEFKLFSNEYPSTYPQNIAYLAAKMENVNLANKYLRLIREETITKGRLTNRKDVLIELANDIGLDIVSFIKRLDDGSAEEEFKKDLKFVKDKRVTGFPTFLLKYKDSEILLRGYQSYDRLKAIIESITGGDIHPKEIKVCRKEIIKFITKYNRVAPIEVQITFDLTKEATDQYLNELLENKTIMMEKVGNGYLISINEELTCDPITGICTGGIF